MSLRPEVNLVTAFGRGEGLAQELLDHGFAPRILDFTAAFPEYYVRGLGPFPIAMQRFLPAQGLLLSKAQPLERGLVFWLPDGPIELAGPMAPFFQSARADVQGLSKRSPEFSKDWLRRFLVQWAANWQCDSWAVDKGSSFPHAHPIGLVPAYDEPSFANFERLRLMGAPVISCDGLLDVRIEGGRLTEVVVKAGQETAVPAEQWVWCLSSRETEMLDVELAQSLFPRGVERPEWSWIRFSASCEHGPWSEGLPTFMVVIGDVLLPWTHANVLNIRRGRGDEFHIWLKVPSKRVGESAARAEWAAAAAAILNARLALAKWAVSPADWRVCPHSPVFEMQPSEAATPKWRNFDWIAPETLPRLDLSARLEKEAECFRRLRLWREEQLKKQGVSSDSALHAP